MGFSDISQIREREREREKERIPFMSTAYRAKEKAHVLKKDDLRSDLGLGGGTA